MCPAVGNSRRPPAHGRVLSDERAEPALPDPPFILLPRGHALDVFAAIHQREERAQDARLGFVREARAAGRQLRQLLTVLSHVLAHLVVTLAPRLAGRRLTTHLHARLLEVQREMQQAALLLLELLRHARLATHNLAIHQHRSPHVPVYWRLALYRF